MRGALIVLEGADRCGKSTQTTRLVAALHRRNIKAKLRRFPDRTTATGKLIDAYLRSGVDLDDRAVHLLFSANRWEAARAMRADLEAGVTLVVDRYAHSGVCFTAAKAPEGAAAASELEWCKAPDRGLPAPDAVLFLKLPIEEAMKRGQFGEERYEKEAFQRRVLDTFVSMSDEPGWEVVDAAQPIDALAATLEKRAVHIIEACADRPIKNLWTDTASSTAPPHPN